MIQLAELQILNPDAIIEMFVLDGGGETLYFHAGTNSIGQNIVWQGNEYMRFPISVTGFEFTGVGPIPRPKLVVSNFMSAISAILMVNDDLLGFQVTRKRTMKKYLDAVNFPEGNPSADPETHFPDDVYYIERKVIESADFVEFELCSSIDLQGVMLPRRQIIQNSCAWKYRSANCGYTGTNCFTQNDEPTTDSSQDRCGKKLKSCKLRFGESSELPYGGFPGADLTGIRR